MIKQKIKRINPTTKERVTMTGTLSLPLCPGERAWIRTRHQCMTTSTVETILEVSESGVKFETRDKIYHLRCKTIFQESGVVCA